MNIEVSVCVFISQVFTLIHSHVRVALKTFSPPHLPLHASLHASVGAFYSVKATAQLHETRQWWMTGCQLAALTEDAVLSALSPFEFQAKTISAKAASEPKTGENQICSRPSASTAVFSSDLRRARRTASLQSARRQICLVKNEPDANGVGCCRNALKAEQWVNWDQGENNLQVYCWIYFSWSMRGTECLSLIFLWISSHILLATVLIHNAAHAAGKSFSQISNPETSTKKSL